MCNLKTYKRFIAIFLLALMIVVQFTVIPQNTNADTNSYELMANNNTLALYVNKRYGYIKLVDRRTNSVWFSNPENWKQDKIAAGSTRMQMASQLTVRFTDVTSTIQIANAYVNSILKRGLKISKIKDGFLATYTFKKEGFVIPVAFTIKDDYLNVDILVNQIKELKKEKYRIVSIMVLPFFGAGSMNDKGYIVVPDGCGALINFNNNKGSESYSQRVYGNDFAIVPDFQGYITQSARIPVFGIKKNKSGFVAIITKGDGKAVLCANTSGAKSSYNNAFVEFILREYDMVTLKEKQWDERTFNIFEERIPNTDKFSIRYYFLNAPNNTYVSMAKKYREYLIKENGLKKITGRDNAPLYVEFYGSMKKQKYIVGLPVNATVPFTRFDDAILAVKQLKNMGIDNIVVKFTGWMKNGVMYNLPLSAQAEGALGGQKALERMLEYFNKTKVRTYLDVDFVTFRKGTLTYLVNRVATKSMKKVTAQVLKYQPSIMYKQSSDDYPVLYLISPKWTTQIIDRFLKSNKPKYFNNLSISSLGSMLYSDFGRNLINRYKAEQIFKMNVQKLKGKFSNIMLTNPNSYLIEQATEVVDLPIYSSQFLIEDAEIPFYQMVIRGYIPYSMPAVNSYTNEWMWQLKALETGSYLKFSWTARNEDELKETLLEQLYSSNYKKWLSDVKTYYKTLYPILKTLKGKEIVDHQIIKSGVAKTVYEGGTEIIVNYSGKSQDVEGQVIAAHGYKVIYKR